MSVIRELLRDIPVPRVYRVQQTFDDISLSDFEAVLEERLSASKVLDQVRPGARIAVTAGSRGITGLPRILSIVVARLRDCGASPFLVPAMGSHGGATAAGQLSVLAHMGITEAAVGAPILSSMDTVEVGRTPSGVPAFMDRFAAEADGVVVVNRVKPHVGFRGRYESGLMKMLAIGLGKERGASACHDLGFGTMARNIEEIGSLVLARKPILFGVAILENAYHRIGSIAVIPADRIPELEPSLQEESKRLSPRLYFDRLDVLIIDEIGKDISGTGFDNNVVGRFHTPYASGGPHITRIAALDVTDRSEGNANGLGILDFTTRRAFEKFDFEQTYPNSLTSTIPTSVKIPMVLESDELAVKAAIKTCNIPDKTKARLARIRNTLKLDEIEVSENLAEEIAAHERLRIVAGPYALPFDAEGNLLPRKGR